MPKISYIVPVYKAEKTVRRCVESIVYGNERDIEVILSEDCSPDNSREVCLQLQEEFPCVKYIRNDQNSGVSHTRNRALDIATGEYILFVDSDDWVCAEYAEKLLETVTQHLDGMVLCGYRFLDQTINYKQDYIYADNEALSVVEKQAFFTLHAKVLMQALWNKVFRRDIIEQHHIRFDESQSMGEDFEFVLLYMKALECERCVVINRPLYSYIRANSTSLMSTFGLALDDGKYRRLRMLRDLAGPEDPVVQKQYDEALSATKNEHVRHVVRSKMLTKNQKKQITKNTLGAQKASAVYRQECTKARWEKIVNRIYQVKNVVKWKMIQHKKKKRDAFVEQQKRKLFNSKVTILAQNCIGGLFYHDMELQFQSPTVNLFFSAADFVKMANDPKRYLNAELTMQMGIDYPIGTLEDITVNFMHYDSCSEAKKAWERRVARVDYDRMLVLLTDRGEFGDGVFEQWKTVSYPKVLFTANPKYAEEQGSVYFPEYKENGCVPDLIPKREFYKDDVLISVVNNMKKPTKG